MPTERFWNIRWPGEPFIGIKSYLDFSAETQEKFKWGRKQGRMVHRAPFGSLERFLAILIEHFAGAFPLWLAPEQVRVLPISDKVADYAGAVLEALLAAGFRATLDQRPEKINAKIRDAQLEKIPAMLVVGAKEAEQQAVSYRDRTAGDLGAMPLAQAIARLKQEADAHSVPPAAASPAPAAAEEGGEQHAY